MLYALWFDTDKEIDGVDRQLQQLQYVVAESTLVHRSELLDGVAQLRDLLKDERVLKTSEPSARVKLTVAQAHEKLYDTWDE